MKKSEILLGKDYKKTVTIDDLEFTIRPLTDGELAMVQEAQMNFIKLPKNLKLDGVESENMGSAMMSQMDFAKISPSDLVKSQREANYLLVSMGVVFEDGQMTPKEVANMPPGLPATLAEEVKKITEANPEDMEFFRQK